MAGIAFVCTAASVMGQSDVYEVPADVPDFGKAINTLLSACPTDSSGYQQCEIRLPSVNGGNWATTVTITSPGVSIVGQGSYASVFNCTVAGDCLRVYTSPFTTQQAGIFKGFQLLGSNLPNGVGIHAGEIEGARWEDLDIQNFAGANGYCLWLDNAHANGTTGTWTERDLFEGVHLQNCTDLVHFSLELGNASFGYNRFLDMRLNPGAGQLAFDIGPAATLYSSTIRATVNAPQSGSSAAAVFSLDSGTVGGNVASLEAELHIFGEGLLQNFFSTAAGTNLGIAGDSSLNWLGPFPQSTVAGTSQWIYGGAEYVANPFVMDNQFLQSLPRPTFYAPVILGGGDTSGAGFTQQEGSPVSLFNTGTNARWIEIATLPASSSSTFDVLDVRVCGGSVTAQKGCQEIQLSNRGGFTWNYMNTMPTSGLYGIQAYQTGGAGSSVNVYLYTVPGGYYEATATVLEAIGGANLIYTGATATTPAGTLIFDSTNTGSYPANATMSVGSLATNSVTLPAIGTWSVADPNNGMSATNGHPVSVNGYNGVNLESLGNLQAFFGNGGEALYGHLNQDASGRFAGTCAMSSGTSCTFTLKAAFIGTPICVATVQGITPIAGACTVAGTTVTVTAATSNSSTWGAMVIGNPN